MTYSTPDEYRSLSDFDAAPTEAQLRSERRSKPPASAPAAAAPAPASFTREWQDYINARVKRAEKRAVEATIEVVGEAMAAMQKRLRAEFTAELERQVAALKIEFLQQQLDAERMKKLKLVPSSSGSMIA
jgi:glucan phosphorylase